MRISFDLDDTLICYNGNTPCEPGLPWWWCWFFRDEPLRQGTRTLVAELARRGHHIWIYSSSYRSPLWIKSWLRMHGIHVQGVMNAAHHAKRFGKDSEPTKRPHAFNIALHVDDSEGVAREGEQYGFKVCLVDPASKDWAEQVLRAIDNLKL